MEFVFIWFGFAVVTAIAANARGHSSGLWFFVGLIGGVFALIAVLVMKPAEGPSGVAGVGTGFSPHANAGPSGPAIAMRNGVLIYQNGQGFWTMGQGFRTLADAERYVDENHQT